MLAFPLAAQPQALHVAADPGAAFPGLAGTRIGIPGFEAVEADQAVDAAAVRVAVVQGCERGGTVGIGGQGDGFEWRLCIGAGWCAVAHGGMFRTATGCG